MTRISISIAALALGATLASAPAFAQQAQPHYGKGINDGGMIDEPRGPAPKPLYNSTASTTVHYGKGLNDGGLSDPPSAKDLAASRHITWTQYPPHYGKAMNDGGM
jgi:hypothetical protein